MLPRLLTINEVAAALGVTRAFVYQLFKTDAAFPKRIYLKTGGRPRIREDELQAWLERRAKAAA